jgi:hypothetical protein
MARFAAIVFASAWTMAQAADFYVAPNGNDSRSGSADQPMATISAARDAARKAGAGPHRIVVMPGEYFLDKTLELDARDNGLTIEAAEAGKVTLYGGRLVSGWRRDGERFWYAELPGVKEGTWDFRALVVNGRLPERARMPESGTLLHRSTFDVPWLSSVGGGWARKPTQQELTTMEYDPKDIPASLDLRNAEVRVYHMWDESLVGTSANDVERHILTFSPASLSPAGAFGVKKYVVFNTREGMTKPGQWYLDRTAGRVVYWPLAGEEMTKAKVVAPVLERIIGITGSSQAPAMKITLRGLSLQATTTPLKPAGFSASAYDGALHVRWARECVFEKLEIANAGGQGIDSRDVVECQIRDNHIHDIGACGIRASGSATEIARNHIHHVGLYHPSAVAVSASHELRAGDEKGFHVYRNEIHDTPYSGIIGGGGGHLIEENLIYRVMREMQDGGAIYGGMKKSILRGNVVRDVVKMGEGYGVSSYYLDEGAEDCVVERNVSIGVERPTHNHITRNLIIRDNVFIADKDMMLSFQRSGGCTFTGNTLFVPGKIDIVQPSAITSWTNNIVYRNGTGKGGEAQAFTIDDAMPAAAPPARRTAPYMVERLAQPPILDGEIGWDEWPRTMLQLDREKSRWSASGAPIFAKVGYDDRYLYVAVNVAMFEVGKLRKGTVWGEDDGMEIAIAGAGGAAYVVRGFADGTVRSVTDAGATAEAAARLGADVKFAAKTFGTRMGGWRGEWAIPLEAIGVKAGPGVKVGFNVAVFRAEDRVWRMLEGTLAESWKVDQAATLQFK